MCLWRRRIGDRCMLESCSITGLSGYQAMLLSAPYPSWMALRL